MSGKVIPFVLILLVAATSAVAGPYFARGSYYAGTGEPWDCDAGNELFDDGAHGDGAADDGVYGAWVKSDQDVGPHDWKIATVDWTENYPHHPLYSMNNAVLYVMNPGDVIHFRLDTNTLGDGWQPATNAVACSHFRVPLPGYEFELMGSAPDTGEWLSSIPVVMSEEPWFATATIAAPGSYEYKLRTIGTWDICNLGIHYNMFIGDNFTYETTDPLTKVRFEFNPVDGRGRAVLLGSVGTEEASWGEVKTLFR